MKKRQLEWIILVLLLILAACGGSDTEPVTTNIPVAVSEDEFGRQISGTDPDSGLEINPAEFASGSMAIVVGEIVSMNLTPTTSPEFVIQTASGKRFRFRSQDLANVQYEDGNEIKLHEFKLGMYGRATIALDTSASLSDVALSENLMIFRNE
jgi:hypothetical protein